jgi:signal transduction histidine kinase
MEDFQVFAGLKPLRTADVDLYEVVQDVLSSLRKPASVTCRVVAGGSLRLRVDRRLLEHAVRNLLKNSLEALAGGGGEIEVTVEQAHDGAVIGVSDDGPGIPAGSVDQVFDPLFTTKREGSGLGLTIVERVAEVHGGTVRVTRSLGRTRFEIRVPSGRHQEGTWRAS